jgi:hypothetical protein
MIEWAIIAVLAAALVVQTYLAGRAQRRLLNDFSEQTKSMIAQADERVKMALSQEEKAYMAFHAAAAPSTFATFRNWNSQNVIGSQYPTKQHFKAKVAREKAAANEPVKKEMPLFERAPVRDPDENLPVGMGLDIDQHSARGRAD